MKRLPDALKLIADFYGLSKDKNGELRVLHPLNVAARVRSFGGDEDQQTIALLHDYLEDSAVEELQQSEEKLSEFSPRVSAAVVVLTRQGDYWHYIQSIIDSGNNDAIRVKIADASENLHRCMMNNERGNRAARYMRVLEMIRKSNYGR